ncbi:hypothetical protein [Streptomyces sp. NPDC059862]
MARYQLAISGSVARSVVATIRQRLRPLLANPLGIPGGLGQEELPLLHHH